MLERFSKNFFFLYFFTFVAILLSCSQQEEPDVIKARLVISTDAGYQLEDVEIKTLINLKAVKGSLAELVGAAVMDLDATEDVLISDDPNSLFLDKGFDVSIDYKIIDGVVYPLNFQSMALLSLYYNYEQIALYWQDKLNLDLNQMGRALIYYDPERSGEVDGLEVTSSSKLNAAFVPGLRSFIFFKTSASEKIPFKMNLGIVAHEFSHSMFDLYFADKDPAFYKTNNKFSKFNLNGINEGLADFFSWVFTQRPAEFSSSLDAYAEFRILPAAWTSNDLVEQGSKICKGGYYCKGSVLATALYEISQLSEHTPESVSLNVIAALKEFKSDWAEHKEENTFDAHYLLRRIVKIVPEEHKEQYCASFKKWFNDLLNSKGLAETCS